MAVDSCDLGPVAVPSLFVYLRLLYIACFIIFYNYHIPVFVVLALE